MATKTYPDTTLEKMVRDAGGRCHCLWEMRGPKNTAVAWIVAYLIEARVVIVQTYTNGDGWVAYTENHEPIESLLAACRAPAGAY